MQTCLFLLSTNLWRKIYNPKNNILKRRAHNDEIKFGFNSIEAFEEFYFKVFLDNQFIARQSLLEHHINDKVYQDYLCYQSLIKSKKENPTYLSKNNNLILRYNSLRKHNQQFKIIVLFRHPLEHSASLLNQHKHFCKLQTNDPFILEYMNWLGHHEFGLNHKYFKFQSNRYPSTHNPSTANYWLEIWIGYYTKILTMLEDKNLVVVNYSDLCTQPSQVLSMLKSKILPKLVQLELNTFTDTKRPIDVEPNLKEESLAIFDRLLEAALHINE